MRGARPPLRHGLLTWEVIATAMALGAFGYSCTAILGYDDIAYEAEGTSGAAEGAGASGNDSVCVPAPGSEAVSDVCGVFVSAKTGDDANGDGTKARPLRTLAKALTRGDVLYTCAAAPFDEAIDADGDATIFGGLDCESGWTFVPGTRTAWTAPAAAVPLRVKDGAHVQLRDVAIAARDAAVPGGSSIAIIAGAKATLDLLRCNVSAGDGQDGATPEAPPAKALGALAGAKGMNGCQGPDAATQPGLGGQTTCGQVDVSGGSGGPGLIGSSGADGSDGSPTGAELGFGDGGKKQDATACTAGKAGHDGAMGAPGAGAKGLGSLSLAGYTGVDGSAGGTGHPGQGGGGGGGAKKCDGGQAGPSGGGGGSGACGGAGGAGGRAGGASIGIVSVNAKLSFADVQITTGAGGKGGNGAQGGDGAPGAQGGPPGSGDFKAKACSGGKGGDGGKGGRGGGGRGGHSIGIAHRGTAPLIAGVEIHLGTAGEGGLGDGLAGDGFAGLAEKTQGFE